MKQDIKLTKEAFDSLLIVKEGLEAFYVRVHIMISNLNALTSNLEQSIVNESNDITTREEQLSEHDMKLLKETLKDSEMIKEGLGYVNLRMNRTISSLDTMHTVNPSVVEELEETPDSTESKQVERETPKIIPLMKQVIALEEQLGIYNNHEDHFTQLSEPSDSKSLQGQLSKLEARLDIIQRKQHQQDSSTELLSFLVIGIEERISSARKSDISPFHLQSEEYRKSTAEAMYDDED
ncbi:hypothetical protein [Paenibacillus macquariensis]|uniref:Uncharacterized protein n=1 Tax=Paenibacillus macquariensis TaxID=948756 RepID=A0ABY1JKA6_9BACL|nr:hypothetical protein [Paenibacillus macquariensis]MEC0089892.1 hypothetical protein [Paenibacillus macquariensis]OAB30647.1 hypothetical protein PMSM_21080 [Paenibacillus macquariensis subsp. macquariensis]SIQ33741.1 hypothetical protein SAMN05421578_101277 [Paenibacillus macquariensis]